MEKFVNQPNQALDNGILAGLLTSPVWASIFDNINEYLTTVSLLLGIIWAVLRIINEHNNRKDKNGKGD